MTTQNARLRLALVSAATQFDAKQAKKRYWNPYALPQYLARIDDVMADIEHGAPIRAALLAGFSDRLLSAMLKAVGETDFSSTELPVAVTYTPVKPI